MRSVFLVFVLLSTPVYAKDLLPLDTGIYVPQDISCDDPARANMVNYTGIGLNAIAICHFIRIHRTGNEFDATQSCSDSFGSRFTVRAHITVLNQRSFSWVGDRISDRTQYKWCRNAKET